MNSFAQKTNFDIVDFTVPKNWIVQEVEGMKVLSTENKQTGSYCVITIFKAIIK
jgi:hypothetical protein